MMTARATSLYCLRIELDGVSPLIWRRMLVPVSITLPQLHKAIQAVMGWANAHLHVFTFADVQYGAPDEFGELNFVNEKGRKLIQVLGDLREFRYEYDFGDGWEHRIVVEATQASKPDWPYPLCIAGERACPPENVGGVPGYECFMEAIGDPQHEEHETYLRWVGGFFDADGFDVNAANERLRRQRRVA